MSSIIVLNEELTDLLKNYFPAHSKLNVQNQLAKSHISISFQKGSLERFFIISGIVSDRETFSAQVTLKNKDGRSLCTTNCNCSQWTPENHCIHSAILFTRYLLNREVKDQDSNIFDHNIHAPDLSSMGMGVHPEDYGRIVLDANRLKGAKPNSTYSSLQYILTNKKIINFPLPSKFKGKLKLNLVTASHLSEFKDYPGINRKFYPIFSLNYADKEFYKVSVFESLYFFNWETGEAFHIPKKFSNVLKFIKSSGLIQELEEYLRLTKAFIDDPEFELEINDKKFGQMDFEQAQFRFDITKSDRKNYLELNLKLHFQDELIPLPKVFKTIAFNDGFLNDFRTKMDCYHFIDKLVESFEVESTEYKKYIHSSSAKKMIERWVDDILENDHIYQYDPHREKVFLISSSKIQKVISALINAFSSQFARYSFFYDTERTLSFQISKNHLFQSVSDFYLSLSSIGIPLYYNENEVKNWNSNIKFERNKSNLNWFSLDLIVDEKDLQIIQNADLSEGFLINNDSLVMLNSEEKELLKFMKKYTEFEKDKSQSSESHGLRRFALNFKRARIFELFELKKHGIEGALTEEEEKLCEKLMSLESMPEYEIASRYKELARNYQLTGYNWLRFLFENKFGACLADDMGLGKTLQTIIFLQSIIDRVEKVLIVCPVSILINWQNEIEKFSNLDVTVYYGNDRSLADDAKVILTSYGVMKKESYSTFSDTNFDILIMDEVQHLKNIRSQGANAARNLNADFRICLTGTPVENDLSEFYNIMDLCIPGIWGETQFLRTTSTKKSRLLARKTVRPFILRRTKEQVLTELPEKVENHVFLNFNDKEKENYLTNLTQIRTNINSVQKGRKYGEILKSLLKLRQLCLWQKTNYLESTKIEFLLESLEQILEENHKAIVFSQFTTYLDIIQNKVQEQGWKFARIDGSQSFKKRAQQVESFQNGDAQVFLISLKAGGVGLNLTAASYIFLMDPWWNPAVESQAIDRAYRIGQENKLTVYRPIIKDSVEEKVLVLQNTKRELFKDLMATEDSEFFNGKLTMDDFQNILS